MGGLTLEERDRLLRIIQTYHDEAQYEINAETVETGDLRIQELKKTSSAFWSSLMAGEGGAGNLEVKWPLNQALTDERLTEKYRHLSVAEFIEILASFVTACHIAEKEITSYRQEGYFSRGDSWDSLINLLAFLWLDTDRRVTAAKRDDPSAKPSAFVSFVAELQTHFLERYRKHTHSISALSGKFSKIVPRSKERWEAHRASEGISRIP